MKIIFKATGIIVGALLLFIGAYMVAAYSLSRIRVDKEQVTSEDVTIYILSNGVHTDLVVPLKTTEVDWSKYIKAENTLAKDSLAKWVAFGWGDKGFYLETPTWADLKFRTAFKAAFALSTSAIHATFYRELKEGENCKSIKISHAQYFRLVEYIEQSLLYDEKGFTIPIKTNANYGDYDAFYEANGKYNLFYTCNTWANNGLKACGQKACLWTPFDKGIFNYYQ